MACRAFTASPRMSGGRRTLLADVRGTHTEDDWPGEFAGHRSDRPSGLHACGVATGNNDGDRRTSGPGACHGPRPGIRSPAWSSSSAPGYARRWAAWTGPGHRPGTSTGATRHPNRDPEAIASPAPDPGGCCQPRCPTQEPKGATMSNHFSAANLKYPGDDARVLGDSGGLEGT